MWIWLFVDLENREKSSPDSCHVINIDIQDNHEEATIGAFMIVDLCTMVGSFVYFLCNSKLPVSSLQLN